MPAPYDYRTRGVDVGNYFDAFRAGRADRMAGEAEARDKAIAQYLPDALQGDETARQQALASGSPDQMMALTQAFAQADAPKLQKAREVTGRIASLAAWADTPDKWTVALAEAKKLDPNIGDVGFEQRGAIIAKAQTVGEQLDQAMKEKQLALDESRTRAQNAASYAAADASRASAARADIKPPAGFIPGPPDPQGNPTFVPKTTDEQAKAVGFANRIQSANQLIDRFEGSLTDPGNKVASAVPLAGNYMVSGNYQQGDQAVRDFINAQLRRESGAVISDQEFDNARRQYIPQPGDRPEVLEQKRQARALAFRNMRTSAGPGGTQIEQTAPAGASPGNTPIVKTQAEFDALPSGAIYVESDGKRYRKP